LLCCDQKGDRVNETKQAQDDESRQPIGISAVKELLQ
jgi:hypothetical protein